MLDYEHTVIDPSTNWERHKCRKCGVMYDESDELDEMFDKVADNYTRAIVSPTTIILVCFNLVDWIYPAKETN